MTLSGPKLNNYIRALHKYLLLKTMNLDYLSLLIILSDRQTFENQEVEISIDNDKISLSTKYVYGVFNIADLKEDEPICLNIQKILLRSSSYTTNGSTPTGIIYFPT